MMRTTLILGLLAGATALAGETPPEGPPWVKDFRTALAEGLTKGKPVFVYHTKTH